jgi:hypothetical protein
MTLSGVQGLSAEDYDLCWNKGGAVLHVLPYDGSKIALCGRAVPSWDGWDHTLNDKRSTGQRVHPLCKQCVEKNSLYDLRTTDEILDAGP